MVEWLKKFWTDPAFFAAAVRSLISLFGGLVASGAIPTDKWRYGFLVMALAQAIPAGNKTPPLGDRLAQATPTEIDQLKAVVTLPTPTVKP